MNNAGARFEKGVNGEGAFVRDRLANAAKSCWPRKLRGEPMDAGHVLAIVACEVMDDAQKRHVAIAFKFGCPRQVVRSQGFQFLDRFGARLFEGRQCRLQRRFGIIALDAERMAVDRGKERALFTERPPYPVMIAFDLDVAQMTDLLTDGHQFGGRARPVGRLKVEDGGRRRGGLTAEGCRKAGKVLQDAFKIGG